MHLALIGLVLAGMLLAGCGGGKKPADKGAAGQPTVATVPTTAPAATKAVAPTTAPAKATAEPTADTSKIENALDAVVKLAPVHLVSSYTIKKGDQVENDNKVEADIDAKGNQHLILTDNKSGEKVELYAVDKKLYLGSEQDGKTMFIQIGDAGDSLVAALSIYGGAFLGFLNDLQNAKKVGSETVNGYQADKYEFQVNTATLGLAGLAAQTQGVSYDFKSYAWVEAKTKALVRSRADWTWKEANADVATTMHQEFDASKGTVQEIKAPENLLKLGS